MLASQSLFYRSFKRRMHQQKHINPKSLLVKDVMTLAELSRTHPISITHTDIPYCHSLFVVNSQIFNDIFKNHRFFKIVNTNETITVNNNYINREGMHFFTEEQMTSRIKDLNNKKYYIRSVKIPENASVHVIIKSAHINEYYFITDNLIMSNIERQSLNNYE
jgi:hypothetical protein